jgi:hypothetical protein
MIVLLPPTSKPSRWDGDPNGSADQGTASSVSSFSLKAASCDQNGTAPRPGRVARAQRLGTLFPRPCSGRKEAGDGVCGPAATEAGQPTIRADEEDGRHE